MCVCVLKAILLTAFSIFACNSNLIGNFHENLISKIFYILKIIKFLFLSLSFFKNRNIIDNASFFFFLLKFIFSRYHSLTLPFVRVDWWFVSYRHRPRTLFGGKKGERNRGNARVYVRSCVSVCIDVCKIIRKSNAYMRNRIGDEGMEQRDSDKPIKTYDLLNEFAFCANIQTSRKMIFDVDFFSIARDAIDPTRDILLSLPVVLKRERTALERIRERYAIYCVTLHVIVIVIVVVVVVVDLFLEFLSGVIATLGQLKTRVPTVGVYISSKVLIKGYIMEVIVGRRVQIELWVLIPEDVLFNFSMYLRLERLGFDVSQWTVGDHHLNKHNLYWHHDSRIQK